MTWGQIFKIELSRIKHIWIDPAWRGEHNGVQIIPLSSVLEMLFMNKTLRQKTYFFSLVTSRTYSIRLTANPRKQIDSRDPWLSFGCLAILIASIAVVIVAIICENSPILRKFDPFWPPVTSNLTWSKNDSNTYILQNLPRPIQRRLPLVAIFLSFRVLWGAVIRPPPPAVRKWLRPPAVRGLTLAPAGVWANMEPAGELISTPPPSLEISRTTQRIEKR